MRASIWRVPPTVIREGKLLLDQQCWCWGQDIRHPEGNLLLEHGFVRERHASEKDLSRYCQNPPQPSLAAREGGLERRMSGKPGGFEPDRGVTLWAFGLFFEGLWMLRKDFKIRLAPSEVPPDIWTVRDAELLYPATEAEGEQLREKLRAACLWIAAYEEQIPRAWRAETLRRWDKKSIPATEQATRWRELLAGD